MAPPGADPLSAGAHTITVHGIPQRYHVYGSGPVCLVQPGGPGVFWEYLRMPALEAHLTMVYVEALGTGDSGRLASHPDGYTRSVYADAIDQLVDHLGLDKVPPDWGTHTAASWHSATRWITPTASAG